MVIDSMPKNSSQNSMVVNTTEEEQQEEKEKEPEDWITIKKRFWEEYASQEGYEAEHTPNREEDTYACELQKKEEDGKTKSMGTVHYTSETSASISKDADLVMYQGLVKDAATHNWSITFGETLDDKQKALLLAAILIHQNEENKTVSMVNAPAIDLNADYFKDLPKEAQNVLTRQKTIQDSRNRVTEATNHTHAADFADIVEKAVEKTVDKDVDYEPIGFKGKGGREL